MIGLVLFGAMLLAGCAPQLAVDMTAPPRSAADRVPAITNAIGVDNDPATFISVGRMNLDPGSRPAGPDALGADSFDVQADHRNRCDDPRGRGQAGLDQLIGDFLPAFEFRLVLVGPATSIETRPASSRAITVRDLMTHTSGLNYAIAGNSPAIEQLKRAGVVPFALDRRTEHELRPRRQSPLQEFAQRAAQWEMNRWM